MISFVLFFTMKNIIFIWGGVVIVILLLYITSPMDGSVSSFHSGVFLCTIVYAIISTFKALKNEDNEE